MKGTIQKIAGKEPKGSRSLRIRLQLNNARPLSTTTTTRPLLASPIASFSTATKPFFLEPLVGGKQVHVIGPQTKGRDGSGMGELVFRGKGNVIPHPDKVAKGGEDAFFVSRDGRCCGVFDGVGSWSEFGVDPGFYSKSLAMECNGAYEESGSLDPVVLLERGWLNCQHITGSSTACCLTISGNQLRAANVGDSGFLVVRQGVLVHRQAEQQHGFNFPYQLGTGSTDAPTDADLFSMEVQPGDVVVLGTDGLFDNLFAGEVVSVVQEGVRLGKNEEEIAQRLAALAAQRAQSQVDASPFSVNARKHGYDHEGGKMDDITVVCCIIAPAAATAADGSGASRL